MKRIHILLTLLMLAIIAFIFRVNIYELYDIVSWKISEKMDAIKTIKKLEELHLYPIFRAANVPYPPKKVVFVGIKDKHVLELWASEDGSNYELVNTSPDFLTGRYASGRWGRVKPDEVAEGIFKVEALNLLELLLIDVQANMKETKDVIEFFSRCFSERTHSVSDLALHASEIDVLLGETELQVLAYKIGAKNITYIITPVDFRTDESRRLIDFNPEWSTERYEHIKKELRRLKKS